MPQPRQGEIRTANGETRVWTGVGWQLVPTGAPTGSVGFSLPPTVPSGRTDADDMATFRRILTVGGATVAPMLLAPEVGIPARLAAAVMGGASGAATGHAMDFHPSSSFGADVAEGGMEGAALEAGPAALGVGLSTAGKGLAWLGSKFNVGSPWMRALAAREMGMPGPAIAAAGAGPPVAQAVGRGAESVGDAIGSETLSQRLSRFFRGGSDATPTPAPPEPSWWHPGQSTEVPYRMPEPSSVTDMGNVPAGPGLPPARPAALLPAASPRALPPAEPIPMPASSMMRMPPSSMPPASIAALERATGGGSTRGMEPLLPLSEDAAAHNITRNAPYGMGQVMPIARPTEFSDGAMEGLHAPETGVYDANLSMTLPRVPDFEFEAGDADVPGVSVSGSPSISALARATKSGESLDDVLGRYSGLMQKHGVNVAAPLQGDVESALQNLGYSPAAARTMATRALADGGGDIGDAVRRSLQYAK